MVDNHDRWLGVDRKLGVGRKLGVEALAWVRTRRSGSKFLNCGLFKQKRVENVFMS